MSPPIPPMTSPASGAAHNESAKRRSSLSLRGTGKRVKNTRQARKSCSRSRAGGSVISSPRNGVEERPAHLAAPAAGKAQGISLPVGEFGKRRVAPRRDHTRIMELVSAHRFADFAERAGRLQLCPPVAEIHL